MDHLNSLITLVWKVTLYLVSNQIDHLQIIFHLNIFIEIKEQIISMEDEVYIELETVCKNK